MLTSQLPVLPERRLDSHKGDYGKVLIIAGSFGMTGAAILAGRAAMTSGAGLVTVATTRTCLPIVASGFPCYTTLPLPELPHGGISLDAIPILMEQVSSFDAIAIGPGLGRNSSVRILLIELWRHYSGPLIVDADGLNALADYLVFASSLPTRKSATILTPHPGEMARLIHCPIAEIQSKRETVAKDFALKHQIILVLKGHGTIITDGKKLVINETGNPGMAKGGAGDVLTGMLTAYVAQGMNGFDAARLAVHQHGLAGDSAAQELGYLSMTAEDLILRSSTRCH